MQIMTYNCISIMNNKCDMKKLKQEVLEFLRKNPNARHTIADLFKNSDGIRLSDLTVHRWIKSNDPRLTSISVLEAIAGFMGKEIDELTTPNI